MVHHGTFNNTCGIGAGSDWNKSDRGIMIKCFEKKFGVGLDICAVHLNGPGTGADFGIKMVGNVLNFNLNFVMKFIRKKRGKKGHNRSD